MNLPVRRLQAACLAAVLVSATQHALSQPGDPQTAPIPDIGTLAADERRGLFLELSIDGSGSVVPVEKGVTNVPPAPTDEAPPMLLFRFFDRDEVLIGQQNAWDPRFEYQRDGEEEQVVLLDIASGAFLFPFNTRVDRISLSNQMVDPPELLAEFEFGSIVAGFCIENPEDFNCSGFELPDEDADGVPDEQDLCPGTPPDAVVDGDGCPLGDAFVKADCKNYGWRTLRREDGSTFRNQGQCVRYVNTGK